MAESIAVRARRFRPRLDAAPLRTRGYRFLLIAEFVSVFGDAFHAVALPWLIYQLGGGARELGLVVGAYGVCRLAATPLGGMLSDRIGPRQVMLISDLGRAALTAGIVVAAVSGTGNFLLVGVLVAGTGLGAGLFQPAAYAITPTLLPESQLQAGNALHTTATFVAGLVGPTVAGFVVAALSPGVAFGVDAVTFAASAACLTAIGVVAGRRDAHAAGKASRGEPGDLTFWQLIRRSSLLRTILVVTAVANLTVGGMVRVGLPSLASTEFASGASGLGGLLAAFAVGSLGGGLFASGLAGLRHPGRTAMASGLGIAGAVLVVPFAGYAGALVALALAGLASTITNVLIITIVQRNTARHLIGRVMSAILLAALGLFPVSTVVSGLVAERYGSQMIFVATGVALCVAFLFGLSNRDLRSR
jgi:predicted MFS family arabinose efflux permease